MYRDFWFNVCILACRIASKAFIDAFIMRPVRDFWRASVAILGSMPVQGFWPIGLVSAFFIQADVGNGSYKAS